jgi:hypothetical protein
VTDLDKLLAAYEKALEVHRDDPTDEKKHHASVVAGERLAEARTAQRIADVEAGIRSPGLGVVAERTGS